MMSIRDKVAIIGVGTTKFGENFTQSYPDMIVEAAYLAFQDAKVAPSQIQAAWLGTCFPDSGGYQGNAGASLADALSLYNVPISRVANYCATGTDAFRNACFAVASGVYDIVLVVGAEKMRDVTPRESLVGQLAETGHPVVGKGVTAPGMFALFATRYFDVFGIGRETLAKVAMKNHRHGSLNPDAHFQKEITLEQYLKAPMVADPLGLYDCCPQTDGAAAAVICRADLASTRSQSWFKGWASPTRWVTSCPSILSPTSSPSGRRRRPPSKPSTRRGSRTRARRSMSPRFTTASPSPSW